MAEVRKTYPPEYQQRLIEVSRATEEEKEGQVVRLLDFQARHATDALAAAARLKAAALAGSNVFDALMTAVHDLSLGQVTQALYEVGGQYRGSM